MSASLPTLTRSEVTRQAVQAFWLWFAFFVVNCLINATLLFILGRDVHAWIYSQAKFSLAGLVVYGGFFLVGPLMLVKGWPVVRQLGFLIPLALAVLAAGLWSVFRGVGVVIIAVLAYLHWRYDLSELGIRSSGWRGDLLAILMIAGFYLVSRLVRPISGAMDLNGGLQTGLDRLMANPATSVEYLFYFGFLAARFNRRLGPLLTSIIIGLMYVAHEISNPEYWYENVQFALVFVGVALACGVSLWRRSIIPIWLGDGLSRFLAALLL